MSEAKLLAKAVDSSGETVVQVFVPGRSDGDPLSECLRLLTFQLKRSFPNEDDCGFGLGGSNGYGVAFENDVFLMHPQCWCEREGECPWCTGCGAYQESDRPDACKACAEDRFPHTAGCYQSELKAAMQPWDEAHGIAGVDIWDWPRGMLSKRSAAEKRVAMRLCRKHGTDPDYGWGHHCTCGADAERAKARLTEGCPYEMGTGIFARFAPWTMDNGDGYCDPPNFWHKPTNFRVTWYKYIGRSQKTNASGPINLGTIMEACLTSIGAPPLAQVIKDFEEDEREESEAMQKAMEWAFGPEGDAWMEAMLEASHPAVDAMQNESEEWVEDD